MTALRGVISRRAWQRILRVTIAMTSMGVALSIIVTNIIMRAMSVDMTLQGLAVSILMPVALGTPMILVFVLRHEQLRQANRQLEQLATTDYLTGCLNRGSFTRSVTARLRNRSSDLDRGAMLVLDVDNFKSVNDLFGHEQGDEALRLIADAIRQAVRRNDLVCRMGGEEFGIFLQHTDPTTADIVAERIRASVAAILFLPDNKPYKLSVSIGGATYARSTEFSVLYRLADHRLYQAKQAGRDRVAMKAA